METMINKKVIFNPLSKLTMTTSIIPVCDYYVENDYDGQISQRNSMIEIYGNEIIENGGELSVSDNGDIIVTRNSESKYSDSQQDDYSDFMTSKDYFFINMSAVEMELMSSNDLFNYIQRTTMHIINRYITEEEKALLYSGNLEEYYQVIERVKRERVSVHIGSEETVMTQFLQVFGDSSLLQSEIMRQIFNIIKIKQLSISSYTDIRTQIYGVARNFYPFLYFKHDSIKDLMYIGRTPKRLSDLGLENQYPHVGGTYQKEITSVKKNLMVVCKQTNTQYYSIPEGWFKQWMYDTPLHVTDVIGNSEGFLDGVEIETNRGTSIIEHNITIDSQKATEKLQKVYNKQIKDRYGFELNIVGTKSQRQTTSKSNFLTDYGFTVPVSKLQNQTQTFFKFQEGNKFVVYQAFDKFKDFTSRSEYYDARNLPKLNVAYMSTAKVQTTRVIENENRNQTYPLIKEEDLRGDLQQHEREMWARQDFEYDEKQIDDGYVKGDFYYMTKATQRQNAGYVGVTCKVNIKIPTSCSVETGDITQSQSRRLIILKSILSIQDLNDSYQIKDTVGETRIEMLSKLYQYLDMWIKSYMPITGISYDKLTAGYRRSLFYATMNEMLVDVDWYARSIVLKDILPKTQTAMYEVFTKTFDIYDDEIEFFPDIHAVNESSYAYEIKTFSGAHNLNQSQTSSSNIQYVPVSLPFDIKKFINYGSTTIHFNALVPSVNANIEMGGGFIGKKQQKIMENPVLRYIVSRSKDYTSGLSNSELVRFEVDTFNTDGLEEIYQNAFPTKKKEINIGLRRMTDDFEANDWEDLYTRNPLITNMVYDHNYLSQTDTIKLSLLVYEKETDILR